MAFLCRQGLARMEVVVGLLIMPGMILGGSEGIKCYHSMPERPDEKVPMYCPPDSNACIKAFKGNAVVRDCTYVPDPPCMEKLHGAGACLTQHQIHVNALLCLLMQPRKQTTSTQTQTTTEVSAHDHDHHHTSSDDRAPKKERENHGPEMRFCYCYRDLCNGAVGSTPNNLVIFAVLLSAVLYLVQISDGLF